LKNGAAVSFYDVLFARYGAVALVIKEYIKQHPLIILTAGYLSCTAISVVFDINISIVTNLNYIAKETLYTVFKAEVNQ
jgi:hypothetical protein